MTIKIRLATPSDMVLWDGFVSAHPNASPYHRMAWTTAVEAAYGHKAYCFICENADSVLGVLPLVYMKIPLSKGALCSLPFCDIGGALSSDLQTESTLLDEAHKLAKSLGVSSLALRARGGLLDSEEPLPQVPPKVSMLLSLPESPEALFASFKSKLRSQVRKAEKNGLTFKAGEGQKGVDAFYEVFAHNMRALGSPVHAKAWFEQIVAAYGDDVCIGLVYLDEQVVGAGIILCVGGAVAIPWASTKAEFNRFAPNMLLYWHMLKMACERQSTTFDFGRSTYGEGTFKFKSQWGAKPAQLNWTTHPEQHDSDEPGLASKIRPTVENIWRKLPLSVVNYLGPKIRRHISL